LEVRDIIVTPIYLLILFSVAFMVRPLFTDALTRRYFIPAFAVRIIGALTLGFIYQFYYHGGDTYNYHTLGSRHVWDAFMDSPEKGLKLFFWSGGDEIGIYDYSSKIYFLRDPSSFMVVRIAAFFDLITFSAYSSTAILFGVFSFIGSWLLFKTFLSIYPHLHRPIAWATLFVPSVFFWGSGLLKDTLTLGALGISTYYFYRIFVQKRLSPGGILMLVLSLLLMYSIKKYIVICFLPAIILWLMLKNVSNLNSLMFKILMTPVIVLIGGIASYYAVAKVGQGDQRYRVDQIAATARVTAYDIAYQSGRDAGSKYTLGELDGTFTGLLKLAPEAINVSLFRPYLWEVRNPLMLMSALESLTLLILTLIVVVKRFRSLGKLIFTPNVIFCLAFSLPFAFAVGVSTYNFGTLSRYKIPFLPFYLLALIFIYYSTVTSRSYPQSKALND
jgi:hypothetical protein